MSGRIDCEISASTGVHDGKALIKQLLAGANSVQAVSTFYKNGNNQIEKMLKELDTWMDANNYKSIDEFRGSMSYKKIESPAAYERVQFMKFFGDKKR